MTLLTALPLPFFNRKAKPEHKITIAEYHAAKATYHAKTQAEAFFKELSQQLANPSNEPLPTFTDPTGSGHTRAFYAMTQMEVLVSANTTLDQFSMGDIFGLIVDLLKAETREESTVSNISTDRDKEGNTALLIAMRQGRVAEEIIRILIEDMKADVNIANHHGDFPLHYATKLCLSPAIYDITDQRTGSNTPAIWVKPLREPDLFNKELISRGVVKDLSLDRINPDYCLMHPRIKDWYCSKDTNTWKDADCTLIAFQNPNFVEYLFENDNLSKLGYFSQHPTVALRVLDYLIDKINKHPAGNIYLKDLQTYYCASEATPEAIQQMISNHRAALEINITYNLNQDPTQIVSKGKSAIISACAASMQKNDSINNESPLHIAFQYHDIELIRAILTSEHGTQWYNIPNQPFLDQALALATEKYMDIIPLLVQKTTDIEILQQHLPAYLANLEYFKGDTEAAKACIEEHPYLLLTPPLNTQYQKQYLALTKQVDNNRERVKTLLAAFENNPIAMLVGFDSLGFKEDIKAILTNPEHKTLLIKYVLDSQQDIGLFNTGQLVLFLLKRYLSCNQKEIPLRTLLTEIQAVRFPQVALYLLDQDLLSKEELKDIATLYGPQETQKEKEQQISILAELQWLLRQPDKTTVSAYIQKSKILFDIIKISNNGQLWKEENININEKYVDLLLKSDDFKPLPKQKNSTLKQKTNGEMYKDDQRNTLFHIAAKTGGAAISIIDHLLKSEGINQDILKYFCEALDQEGKTPLEIALERSDTRAIETLIDLTKNDKLWRSSLLPDAKGYRSSLLHIINNIRSENGETHVTEQRRLLNDSYRKIFDNFQTLNQLPVTVNRQEALYAAYNQQSKISALVFQNYPDLLEGFLQSPISKDIIEVLQDQPLTLSKALSNEKFCTTLKTSSEGMEIISSWALHYGIDVTKDNTQKEFETLQKELQQALTETLKKPQKAQQSSSSFTPFRR